MKELTWIILYEEESLGYAELSSNRKIFVVEKTQRFEAPIIAVTSSLKEAVLDFCNSDEDDLQYKEEKEEFDKIYKLAKKEIKKLQK